MHNDVIFPVITLVVIWISVTVVGIFLVLNTPNPDPLLNVLSFLVGATLVLLIYTGYRELRGLDR